MLPADKTPSNHALDNRTVPRRVGCVPNAATSMFPDRVVRFANRGRDTTNSARASRLQSMRLVGISMSFRIKRILLGLAYALVFAFLHLLVYEVCWLLTVIELPGSLLVSWIVGYSLYFVWPAYIALGQIVSF